MREAFQILDQDSDGTVNREDVAEMLKQLGMLPFASLFTGLMSTGLDSSAGSLAPYFPASLPYPLPLAVFLSQLSSLLAPISPPQELLAALSAFDDDDSGQIDVSELIQAVTSTRPEDCSRPLTQRDVEAVLDGFTGRRAFSAFGQTSNKNRGDVFRYRDWVSGLGAAGQPQAKTAA